MTKAKSVQNGWNLEHSYASLPKSFYTLIDINPVQSPELIILNHSLATFLGLDIKELQNEEGIAILAGNAIPEGGQALAQAYAGHQFGHFTMLGDGRALLHGEQITPQGQRFDIQLKGSGKTPFSRGGDGRAALGPMLREYIISEAMHELGIPTTRSLAVVTTGEPVVRETMQPGAIMTRVASSHLRVGTFEYASKWGTIKDLKALADYTLQRHFPDVKGDDNQYLSLLKEVIKCQAALIAKWQMVGFIHGVMNTDNMALSGETIDYGPCAFMDTYDEKTVFSSIDSQGRYAYDHQPAIAGWNLARFAETLIPLLNDNQEEAIKLAQEEVYLFTTMYQDHWLTGMRSKLGLIEEETKDKSLIEDLLRMMQEHGLDYTQTFRALTYDNLEHMDVFKTSDFTEWLERWKSRREREQFSKDYSHQLMMDNNPALIPRNHRVEDALAAAENHGDYTVMDKLLDVLANPYAHSPEQIEYDKPPEPSSVPYRTFCGT